MSRRTPGRQKGALPGQRLITPGLRNISLNNVPEGEESTQGISSYPGTKASNRSRRTNTRKTTTTPRRNTANTTESIIQSDSTAERRSDDTYSRATSANGNVRTSSNGSSNANAYNDVSNARASETNQQGLDFKPIIALNGYVPSDEHEEVSDRLTYSCVLSYVIIHH